MTHGPDPIALAIPGFLALIALEGLVVARRGHKAYRVADTVTSLACGMTSEASGLLFGAMRLGAYAFVEHHFALWRWDPTSAFTWLVGIVGLDVIYYFWHRASHEVSWLWAAHVVHHQSEDYNLGTALRQSWFTTLTNIPFFVLLALVGIPTEVFALSWALNLLYQFWVHTETIERLPAPVEAVFNTPSHHRVHHGRNPQYLDRNHGGIFIVWDRLFGTFEPEGEPVVYGTVAPFERFDALAANVQPILRLWDRIRQVGPKWRSHVVWGSTTWRTPEEEPAVPPPSVQRETTVKRETNASPETLAYVAAWVLPNAALVAGLLLTQHDAPTPWLVAGAALVFWTAGAWGGLLDQRGWGVPMEGARLGALLLVLLVLAPSLPTLAAAAAMLALAGSGLALFRLAPVKSY